MNLQIKEIGKGQENLLIHGKVTGEASKMLHFVLASPLKRKLAKLDLLTLKGLLSLDLGLQIPLYPENDHDLVRGN